jgi:hypothetical protein
MKIKEGFIMRNMGGQAVVVSIGAASKVFNGMVKLNETGEFLWKKISEGAEREDLIQALLEKYEVNEETANRDVDNFIQSLEQPGIIE